ncbi:MAG: carbonic anhydrase, partial [Qingshengfaniella sp.]
MIDTTPPPSGIRPLPSYLVQRYRGWKSTDHQENKAWYRRLAYEGQRPRCMIVSCCDSRVNSSQLFGAGSGEFFIHRNIANLIPPCEPDGDHHGTSAAIEFAVQVLKISNLVVMAHSLCGGVKGCHDMCTGRAPELQAQGSFVGRWMDILKPGYERVKDIEGDEAQLRALEKQSVIVSLENLMTFPFVREAVENETLALHGLW